MQISSISWRRNGNANQTAPARTSDLQIGMGYADFGLISQAFDENFLPATRTTVFPLQPVNFPDWSANQGAPGPWDFTAPLTPPFVYTGLDALVIDFIHTNNSTTSGVSVDRHFVGSTTPPGGTALGTGCVIGGQGNPFSHTAYMANYSGDPDPLYALRFRFGGSNATPFAPVFMALDTQNANINGLLCSTVYALPTVTIPLAANGTGVIPEVNMAFPFNNFLLGATFYSQLVTVDPTQAIPVAVSNGRQTTMPAAAAANLRCSYGWNNYPNDLVTSAHFVGGGIVMLLQ